jgi:hypothetical protein
VAKELQHNLGRGFEVLRKVKPGSSIKVVTNTMNSSSLTKKYVLLYGEGLMMYQKMKQQVAFGDYEILWLTITQIL